MTPAQDYDRRLMADNVLRQVAGRLARVAELMAAEMESADVQGSSPLAAANLLVATCRLQLDVESFRASLFGLDIPLPPEPPPDPPQEDPPW